MCGAEINKAEYLHQNGGCTYSAFLKKNLSLLLNPVEVPTESF